MTLPASAAMRPYSVAVFLTDLPGTIHLVAQAPELYPVRFLEAMGGPQIAELCPSRMIAILEVFSGLVRSACPEVDPEHRFDVGQFAPGDKFVRAKRVRFGAHPGEIQSAWAGFHRADPVLPVAPRHVVASGIANDSRAKLSDQIENVTTKAVGIRGGMARLKDARIDAASHMFHERAEKATVELGNAKIGIDDYLRFIHGKNRW